jgi:hypothetical protein
MPVARAAGILDTCGQRLLECSFSEVAALHPCDEMDSSQVDDLINRIDEIATHNRELFELFQDAREVIRRFMEESALVLSETAEKIRHIRRVAEENRFVLSAQQPR